MRDHELRKVAFSEMHLRRWPAVEVPGAILQWVVMVPDDDRADELASIEARPAPQDSAFGTVVRIACARALIVPEAQDRTSLRRIDQPSRANVATPAEGRRGRRARSTVTPAMPPSIEDMAASFAASMR